MCWEINRNLEFLLREFRFYEIGLTAANSDFVIFWGFEGFYMVSWSAFLLDFLCFWIKLCIVHQMIDNIDSEISKRWYISYFSYQIKANLTNSWSNITSFSIFLLSETASSRFRCPLVPWHSRKCCFVSIVVAIITNHLISA